MLCAKFGWNWVSGSGEEVENVKSLQTDRRTDRQTKDRHQTTGNQKSSGELKTSGWIDEQKLVQNPGHAMFVRDSAKPHTARLILEWCRKY